MIILGKDVIIIDVDTARKLVKALYLDRSREGYERLQELGLLYLIDEFRVLVKRRDAEEEL